MSTELKQGNFIAVTADEAQSSNFYTAIYEDDDKGLLIALCNQNGNHPYQAQLLLNGLDGKRQSAEAIAALSAKLAEAERAVANAKAHTPHFYSPSVMHMGDCSICGNGPDSPNHNADWKARAEASEAKLAEAERERDRYLSGLQALATTFFKGDQHQDYAKHVLGTALTVVHPSEARVAELEKALKPFAKVGGYMKFTPPERGAYVSYNAVEADGINSHGSAHMKVADFRAALAATKEPKPATRPTGEQHD